MQRQGHDNSSSTHLEHFDGGDDTPTGPHRGGERDLNRYEEEEVATAPWPPPQPS